MSTAIFIRSFRKDFPWLDFCTRSIRRYCTGFDELVLAVPVGQSSGLNPDTRGEANRVVEVNEVADGYMEQQITKIQAHKYTNCDRILYVDSDCMFFEPCTPADFMRDGKPILLKTHYDVFRDHQKQSGAVQSVLKWQAATEKALGFAVKYEWMRRIPMIHLRSTLVAIDNAYPDLAEYIRKADCFSEFNFIGAYANRFLADNYHIQDTECGPLPRKVAEQYWSWGGISDELREHLKCTCL